MNAFEKEVLSVLKEDSRLSADKIAAMLGVSTQAVTDCIRGLECRGVLVKYTAIANEELADSSLLPKRVKALTELPVGSLSSPKSKEYI